MSPLETSTTNAGASPNDSPSAAAAANPSSATTPSANSNNAAANESNGGAMLESLGDALAGVNLGFHTSTPTGAPSTTDTSGWGNFSNPEASRNSFARNHPPPDCEVPTKSRVKRPFCPDDLSHVTRRSTPGSGSASLEPSISRRIGSSWEIT